MSRDDRTPTRRAADDIRRDLGYADKRRENAASLERMADWLWSTKDSVQPLLVIVDEHVNRWVGIRHTRRDLALDEYQSIRLGEFLRAESVLEYKRADGIETSITRDAKALGEASA